MVDARPAAGAQPLDRALKSTQRRLSAAVDPADVKVELRGVC